MRIAPWLVAAAVIALGWRYCSERDIERAPGVLVAEDPVQTELGLVPSIEHGQYRLHPRAGFRATVRILRREDYEFDRFADLVPTDFAVGWGPMSDSQVLADVQISQSGRFYFWRTQHWPIERSAIETHSANWHVIPGSSGVAQVLGKLRAGSVVELAGRLVDIEAGDGGMRTSLTRADTGAGACEILLAETARLVEIH
jgi:hypothetical protein